MIFIISCENQNTPTVVEPPVVVDSSKKVVDFLNNKDFKLITINYNGFNCSYYSWWSGTDGSGSRIDSNYNVSHNYMNDRENIKIDSLISKDSTMIMFLTYFDNDGYDDKFYLSFKFEKETSKLDSFYLSYLVHKFVGGRSSSYEFRDVKLNFKSLRYELVNDSIFSISLNYDELQKSFKNINYRKRDVHQTYFGATNVTSFYNSDGYIISFKNFDKNAYFKFSLSK
jgi:hypothetical protein